MGGGFDVCQTLIIIRHTHKRPSTPKVGHPRTVLFRYTILTLVDLLGETTQHVEDTPDRPTAALPFDDGRDIPVYPLDPGPTSAPELCQRPVP